MFIDVPANPSGLCVVTDCRFKYDKELQEEAGGQPVLREYGFGKAALGKRGWSRVTRIALYDYAEDPEALTPAQEAEVKAAKAPTRKRKALIAQNRQAKREELRQHLRSAGYKLTIVMASRSSEVKMKDADMGDAHLLKGTMCFDCLNAPDSLDQMAGTLWHSPTFGTIMPMLSPANHEYVWGAQIRNWFRGAEAYVDGRLAELRPEPKNQAFNREPKTMLLLQKMMKLAERGSPVAIDIETIPTTETITCIGFACGPYTVSVPWEPFPIHGGHSEEPGGARLHKKLAADLMALPCPKVFHNASYDVTFLTEKGYVVGGRHEDTMLMHGVVYRQYRHGLQRAVAGQFLCQPWKSQHHDPRFKKYTKAAWTSNPKHLREYNSLDAFFTLRLAEALAPKVGLKWTK